MTLSTSTLYTVRCDGKLHTACHDHQCPASVSAHDLGELQHALNVGRWLLPPGERHYCPSHRDEQTTPLVGHEP